MIKVTTEIHRVLKLYIYVFIVNLSVLSILYIFIILASKAVTSISTNYKEGGVVVVIVRKLDFQLPVQSVVRTPFMATCTRYNIMW